MTPEDWQRAKEILEAALARPTHERSQYVADRCVGDDVLRQEIQSLLTACNVAHPRDGHWWEFLS